MVGVAFTQIVDKGRQVSLLPLDSIPVASVIRSQEDERIVHPVGEVGFSPAVGIRFEQFCEYLQWCCFPRIRWPIGSTSNQPTIKAVLTTYLASQLQDCKGGCETQAPTC